jgi:cell volume regulation protein A
VDAQDVLRDVGLILLAGVVAIPIAALLRLPAMVVLLAAGVVLGPSVADLVENPVEGLGAQLVFTLGVSLILFHGGLGISLRVISQTAVGLGLLVLPGIAITAVVVALVAMPVFSLSFSVALLVGATLAATDPAILIPLFDRLRLRPKISQTVIAESAFNDPTATVLALTVAGVVEAGRVGATEPLTDFVESLAIGAALAIGAGVLLAVMLSSHALGIWRESPAVAILALVALTYFTTDEIGGSAYLAAFVMGLIVGNMDRLGLGRHTEHEAQLDDFMRHVSELAVLAVFVTLGINLPLDALWDNLWGGLVVMAAFLFLARPLTVLACLLPDRRGHWTREEIVFLSWCRETGVVPAAVAGLLLARGVEGAEIVAAMVALAVVTTLLVQATTAGALARRLGLVEAAEYVGEPPASVSA